MVRPENERRATRILAAVLAALALVPFFVQHGGYGLSGTAVRLCGAASLLLLACFLAELVLARRAAVSRRAFWRERFMDLLSHALLATLLLDLALGDSFLGLTGGAGAILAVQIDLAILFFIQLVRLFQVMARAKLNFSRVFVGSFVVIIPVGAVLLWALPGTKAPGRSLTFLDALFTATSATCVTGLVVHDTGAQFSRFGQALILILIQVGGLGIMTFTAFFAMALGQGFGLKDRAMMRDLLNVEVLGRITRVLVAIVTITFLVEAAGAVLLYGRWTGPIPDDQRAWFSVFHSVSAFCNAGFALLGPDSLSAYRGDSFLNIVVMGEIVLGGLGFVVILDLLRRVPLVRRLVRDDRDAPGETGPRRPSVQTRIVLVTSLLLIAGGALLFWLVEKDNPATLGVLPPAERAQAAIFQSVTARTAGFNTIDVSQARPPAALLTIFLMFIGASPGSTGGGLKTVTFVVLLLTVIGYARGRARPELMGRSIPVHVVSRCVVIVSCYALLALLTLFLLCVTEPGKDFLALGYETVSALGTVGLSMGVTGSLSEAGKIVLSVAMLVGRIGPLTLVVAMAQGRTRPDYDFPEARLMIG